MVLLSLFAAGIVAWGIYTLFFSDNEDGYQSDEKPSPPGTPVSSSDEDEADYPNGRPVTIEDYQNPQPEDDEDDCESTDTDTTEEFDVTSDECEDEDEDEDECEDGECSSVPPAYQELCDC